MTGTVECQPIEFSNNGVLRAVVDGRDRMLTLRGVVVPPEAVAGVNQLIARLRAAQLPARCPPVPETAAPAAVAIEYLAWRDKSGDVWEDLAVTLLKEGLARADVGDLR